MTPLAAARLIAAEFPPTSEDACALCFGRVGWDHATAESTNHEPACPWLLMPRIVAALEAADRVVAVEPFVSMQGYGGHDEEECGVCGGEDEHAPDCDECKALRAALAGEDS